MRRRHFPLPVALICLTIAVSSGIAQQTAVELPRGVKAVWEIEKAVHQTTPTRQRISLNGLWRWQPADAAEAVVPAEKWGYFKVPGAWPGISDYMQKDCQTLHAHPAWKNLPTRTIGAAWHQRTFAIPAEWAGRRITLGAQYVNSVARVYVDGKSAGEIRFPAGEVDLTSLVKAGTVHTLSLHVTALPLKAVMIAHRDTATAREVRGSVARRGLCGDVWLTGEPASARIADVKINTSVRKGQVSFDVALCELAGGGVYGIKVRLLDQGQVVSEFGSAAIGAADLREGRIVFTHAWKPRNLWDLHTPANQFQAEVTLVDASGKALDTALPVTFGYREFWIEGRDFYLNGTRIFLSSVPLDNAQVGAAWSTYDAAKESLKRLQSFGINFVYTHNYGCEPGSHLGFEEILRAADDVGMLVAMSQPHFAHYDWKMAEADKANGYAGHAEFYVRVVQNHPSAVAYSMSHNATGYMEDMNPDMIDGLSDPRDQWAANNAKLAMRAEAIVKRIDPVRIVYHHASGNLGSMHPVNFYANFIPIQEQSDWFEHWATKGVKPVFTCEYSVPFTWDWALYRGWHKGQREFGSAAVPWELCIAQWNAQFIGDRAYAISEHEKTNLRWEAKKLIAGQGWHRWDYPVELSSTRFAERYPIIAAYLADNWRAFRTWGVSANSPWEHGHYWRLRDGVDKSPRAIDTDWENLQRPGISPDFIKDRYERMDLAFEIKDWIATPAAEALVRNNQPLLAFIGGKPGAVTGKDHNVRGGDIVEKQIVIINNSRSTTVFKGSWNLTPGEAVGGPVEVEVQPGEQAKAPIRVILPDRLAPGSYVLKMAGAFSNGQSQEDSLSIQVLPPAAPVAAGPRRALFDPVGRTAEMLEKMGVAFTKIDARADLSGFDILIIGQAALTTDGAAPDVARVRDGLRVILFEQKPEVLERRLGFRIAEYGLRRVFERVKGHPAVGGLSAENLHDWCGHATLQPPRLVGYETRPRHGPTVKWCDIPVSHAWRCGNRGSVASVLIEKPACGDFLSVLDGGFGLQYSPLLEYREGKGLVLLCQMDVTGRTELDPAADTLVRNLLRYAAVFKPGEARQVLYSGDPAGRRHLESTGVSVIQMDAVKLSPNDVLVVTAGAGVALKPHAAAIAQWIERGGQVLAIGLDAQESGTFLPARIRTQKGEHISAVFESAEINSPLAGVGPADVYNRDPRMVPLVTEGAKTAGNGILAQSDNGRAVFCQTAPWQFDMSKGRHLKQTFRITSRLISRLLCNTGVHPATPLLERIATPVSTRKSESRWLTGFYLDQPEEWDDPYRFFRW